MQKEITTPFEVSPELKAIAKQRWGTLEQRFWRKITKDGPIVNPSLGPCWQWIGGRAGGRYGCFWFDKRRQPASRVSWIFHNGPIPEGMHVLHKCDNPPCVNPNHLFLGTVKDNMQDACQKGKFGNRKGVQNARHKLTESEVIEIRRKYASGGWTQCGLAREYRVSQPNIKDIVNGNIWKHI